MSTYIRSVDNLLNGVSQQTAHKRLENQAEEQVNCFSSVLNGLTNRPPTELLGKLRTISMENGAPVYTPYTIPPFAYTTMLNTAVGCFVIVIHTNVLKAFRVKDGLEVPVLNPENLTLAPAYGTYDEAFDTISVGDHGVLLNKTIVTAMASSVTGGSSEDALLWIKEGYAGTTYNLAFGDTTVSYTTTTDALTYLPAKIADELKTRINNTGLYTASRYGAVLYIVKGGNQSFETTVSYSSGWSWPSPPPISLTSDLTIGRYTININDGIHGFPHIYSGWTYGVNVGGFDCGVYFGYGCNEAAYSGNSATSKNNIANLIAAKINATGIYQAVVSNTQIVVTKRGAVMAAGGWQTPFTLTVDDSRTGQLMGLVKGQTPKVEDLPPVGVEGQRVRITGRGTTKKDDYWLCFTEKIWKETTAPLIKDALDPYTMPLDIYPSEDGTYLTLKPFVWEKRLVGDDDTVKIPSFVGQRLTSVFFHKNRLGFTAGDSVVMSCAGQAGLFNFWPKTATSVLDSDPIDITVGYNRRVNLRQAISRGGSLLLFGESENFLLTSNQTLTPKDCSAEPIAAINLGRFVPQPVLNNIECFILGRGEEGYARLLEFSFNNQGELGAPADVTSHAPHYITEDVLSMASLPAQNTVLVMTRTGVYVYSFLNNSEGRVMASLSKWTFDPRNPVRNIAVDSDGDLILTRSTSVERMQFTQELRPTLDSQSVLTTTYDTAAQTLTIPGWNPLWDMAVVTESDTPNMLGYIVRVADGVLSNGNLLVPRLAGVTKVVAGTAFDCSYVVSRPFIRDREGAPVTTGRYQILRIGVKVDPELTLGLHVKTSKRVGKTLIPMHTRMYTPILLKGIVSADGEGSRPHLVTTPVLCQASEAVIEFTNSPAKPFAIMGYELTGSYNSTLPRR